MSRTAIEVCDIKKALSASGTITNSLLDAAVLSVDSAFNGTYNIANQVQTQYGSLIPYIILTVNQPIKALGGNGGVGRGGQADAGSAGYSAIQTGTLPTSTILKIINNAQIYAGGGGGGGGGNTNVNGGHGGDYSNNGIGGNGYGGISGGSNGGAGYGAPINRSGAGGGGSWGNGGGGGAESGEGGGSNGFKGQGGAGGYGGGGNGGDGGCAIEIPSSSLNGVTINIVNNGVIAGRVENQLAGYNLTAIIYNGRGYCYK